MKWKTIFKSLKNKDMQKRLLIVLAIIVIYRFLTHIPIPLAEPTQLKDIVNNLVSGNDFGNILNLITGGALAQVSIILIGLGPFITASIVFQLANKVFPRLEELHKDGETGRRRINQWTRMVVVPLAIVQSIGYVYTLRQTVASGNTTTALSNSPMEWFIAVLSLTVGAVLMMWLGELITEQGIGNGISLLIFAGIISQMPQSLGGIITSLTTVDGNPLTIFNWFTLPINATAFYVAVAITVITIISLYLLVKINEAQRIITINYAKRVNSNSAYGGVKSILPVKLIVVGVIPVIFAISFITLPMIIGQFLSAYGPDSSKATADFLVKWFTAPTADDYIANNLEAFVYPGVYFLLIIMFSYFYAGIAFNSNEISEGLARQGGFIEGVRPGVQTEKYLTSVVNRLLLFGAVVLGFVAVMPFIVEYVFSNLGLSVSGLAIGGTGLLIVVSVGLETLRQINSRALMVTYDDYK